MSTEITIPSFKFSGLYYPDILQDLLVWKRLNLPDLNDEDPNEPLIQMLRAFALVAHYNNVLIDHVALESFLDTARMRDSVKQQLKLIGYTLSQSTAASTDLLFTLTGSISASQTLAENLIFSSSKTESLPEIEFETGSAITLSQTDKLTDCFSDDGGVIADHTADFGDAANPNAGTQVLGGTYAAGDALYFGHDSVLFDSIRLSMATAGTMGTWVKARLEYYDGQLDQVNPSFVIQNQNNLTIGIDSLVGLKVDGDFMDMSGAQIQIRCTKNGTKETVASQFTAVQLGNIPANSNYITTTGFLGQSSISTVSTDYLIGCEWQVPDNWTTFVDTSSDANAAVAFAWTIPETLVRKWQKYTLTDALGVPHTGYYVRIRYVATATPAPAPTITHVQIDHFKSSNLYVKASATQGHSYDDDPAGISTGDANQSFTTTRDQVIDATVKAFVDEQQNGTDVEYTEVSDFLSSASTSRHFTVDFDDDGKAVVSFGDGTNGKIPPLNSEVRISYRTGADSDGNVGASTITNNKSGESLISSVTNPRPASGWKTREGTTPLSLRDAKIAGPASLRTLSRALSRGDVDSVSKAFTTSDGSSPVVRAYVAEEALGPKTVVVYVVGTGGGAVATETMTLLQEHLNGNLFEDKNPTIVLNTEATVKNYVPRVVNVVAVVKGGNATKIRAAIEAFISPIAMTDEGVFWHDFGDKLYREGVVAEIFQADDGNVKNVATLTLDGLSSDVNLNPYELPVLGTLNLSVEA